MMLVGEHDIQRYVTFDQVLAAVERAFISLHQGTSALFDVVWGHGGGEHHFFAIKSVRDGSIPMLGLNPRQAARSGEAQHVYRADKDLTRTTARANLDGRAVDATNSNSPHTLGARQRTTRTIVAKSLNTGSPSALPFILPRGS